MSKVILACGSLAEYVTWAQEKMHTDIPVICLDRKYHIDPSKMREAIIRALHDLPDTVDTVLVAMGYCGGSWKDISSDKTIVMPKVDDCISLLLTTDDEPVYNRKDMTHLYVRDRDPRVDSVKKAFGHYTKGKDEEAVKAIYDSWSKSFDQFDIVDTGLFDCHTPEYYDKVRIDADWLSAGIGYVKGSNRLIEKLVSGKWDEQFEIIPPKENI